MGELPPNGGPDLCKLPWHEPSRSRRAIERGVQGRRDGQLPGDGMAGDRTLGASPSLSASNTALVISSTNSGMPSVRSIMSCRITFAGSELIAGDAVDHCSRLRARIKPVEGEGCDVWSSDPRRLEFRPEGHDQQHAKSC